MIRSIDSAAANWNRSIIERSSIDELFSPYVKVFANDDARIEASKLILVKQSTRFAWVMFDDKVSIGDIAAARKCFEKFNLLTANASYPPPAMALRKLDGWLSEKEKQKAESGRPAFHFDSVAYPWLIAFFAVVFVQPAGGCLERKNYIFIHEYFKILSASLVRTDISIKDSQGRGRVMTKPTLIKGSDAVRKSVKTHRERADQYMPLIETEIYSLRLSLEKTG
jgi:hypothetical protein